MPNDPTVEQIERRRKGRQRLIGAVVLALAVVVFVPMLLDPEPRREREQPELAIPPREGLPAPIATTKPPGTAVLRQAAPEPVPRASAVTAAPATSSVASPAPDPRKTVEPKAAEFKPAPPGARTEPKPATPAPVLEGFAVQVGAFRDDAKLAQARERIAAARLAHYTERLDGASGELTRLRAGPFPTREAAERAAAQLKRSGLETRVVSLP